ncbi:MAG TPA: alpha/beta fold hydrolase [Roseiflexaceae bacterium]|nr:alpha/beta fold hydrolase [Roseiflexaceae bacterium]
MLSYDIVGDGPPMLLIHGLGITRSVWRNLESQLSQRARLILVELPGFGQSPPPSPNFLSACVKALVELRQRLGISRWTVLSYSCSADIGRAYIRRDAAHVAGGIFLCPIQRSGRWPVLHFMGCSVLRWWPGFTAWLFSGARLRWMIVTLAFNGERHTCTREWFQEISAQPIAILEAQLTQSFDPIQTELSPEIPVLRIWGRYDRLAARPRSMGPHDRVIEANHGAPLLASTLVLREVYAFLQRQAEAGAPASVPAFGRPGAL